MEQREPSEKHVECSEPNSTTDKWTNLNNMEGWTKDDVFEWLIMNKVPEQYAKILSSKDVYGASLIQFDKQDLLELGLAHGPAVHITKIVTKFKKSSEHIAIPKDTDAETEAAESPTAGFVELETPAQISIEENRSGISGVQRWSSSKDIPKYTGSERKSFCNVPPFQGDNILPSEEQNNSMYAKADEPSGAQSLPLPLTQCTKQTNNVKSETRAHLIDSENLEDMSKRPVFRYCAPRPFDESSETFEYKQNDILPPETGPSNCIDPLHEYKLLANTEDALEENVLKKFSHETFWFAAACMNTRSNGTIHFGVGDKPLYKHGQIIGLEVPCRAKYVDEFDKGLKEHFKGKSNIAMTCIRPPKFVKVICPDNKDKWVIEIDVVPKYKLTQKKFFFTTLDKKKGKSKCFFIRSGANTINYFPENNVKIFKQKFKNLKENVELWALARQLAEEDIAGLRPCFHQCICSRGQRQLHANTK